MNFTWNYHYPVPSEISCAQLWAMNEVDEQKWGRHCLYTSTMVKQRLKLHTLWKLCHSWVSVLFTISVPHTRILEGFRWARVDIDLAAEHKHFMKVFHIGISLAPSPPLTLLFISAKVCHESQCYRASVCSYCLYSLLTSFNKMCIGN